ncbi:PepSY domain-containing protein [Kitasatospora sp. NPDC059795]|uniref:PepSY domain-containing protein n=1 Tax=Kitasatospora sp. NPDC059795 TaxID=3346949 RepID=UPI0036650B07
MSEPQSEPFESEAEVEREKAARRRRFRLPKRRGGRWALGAAVAVVLGVGAVTVGAALHHPEHSRPMWDRTLAQPMPGAPEAPWAPGAHKDGRNDGRNDERKGGGKATRRDGAVQPGGRAAQLAPAALPTVPADQALTKAVGAVPGGKADALSVVGREGGGSSWAVEVLGTDGVRHLVTVDGADGSITGNTTVNGR